MFVAQILQLWQIKCNHERIRHKVCDIVHQELHTVC